MASLNKNLKIIIIQNPMVKDYENTFTITFKLYEDSC